MNSVNTAFESVKRADFVPPAFRDEADVDAPLPIGHGQTISQPTTVRMMLEWLGAKPGHRVLDVGSGSGWTTALLANIVGPEGKIYAVEKVPELVNFGRQNCKRAGVKNATFFEAGKTYGLPEQAPFDRILVSAAASKLPNELVVQLKIGGKLVVPVKNTILEITKTGEKTCDTLDHYGFIFVPLV